MTALGIFPQTATGPLPIASMGTRDEVELASPFRPLRDRLSTLLLLAFATALALCGQNLCVRGLLWLAFCGSSAFFCWRDYCRRSSECQIWQEMQRDLMHRAMHDEVTGLPNRAAADAYMERLIQARMPFTCIALGIHGLSTANDLFGHSGGDQLLRSVVERVRQQAPAAVHLARSGGGRLLLLFETMCSADEVKDLSERIVATFATTHRVRDRDLTASVSIGIANYPNDAADCGSLIGFTEAAVLAARRAGGNGFRFAQDLTDHEESRRQLLAVRLERALHTNALHLVYQPVFNAGGSMIAVEALARWCDPSDGFISPADFIPVAESTGLIVPLSNWVLRQACLQMTEWLNMQSSIRRVCVNVSVKQVWRSDFVATVHHILLETGLTPEKLELEVTESALATDFQSVQNHLQELRRSGVRISIDDFGTGYSSLNRVRELDADVLKIDRTLVQGATDTPSGVAVVHAIVEMAHKLNLSVIAEGIETAEQLQMLKNMGCDEFQGFLLARPQAPDLLRIAPVSVDAPRWPDAATVFMA